MRRWYRTARWQKTRKYVIARAGGLCEIKGPRCQIVATQAHHVSPSSRSSPEKFFDPAGLVASCRACNSHGGQTKRENTDLRQEIEALERENSNLKLELEVVTRLLAKYEDGLVDDADLPSIA